MIEALQDGYRRGWSFTPLDGKVPRLKEWQTQPRASLTQAMQWATLGNIGLRTGSASGIVVVDVDSAKGGEVPEGMPPTVCVQTGGGGWHFYFTAPTDYEVRNTAGLLGPHVDTRGEGGQVVFVGSLHPETGAYYQWAQGHSPAEIEIAEFPRALWDRMEANREAKRTAKPTQAVAAPVAVASTSRVHAYVEKALGEECTAVANAAPGTRNARLNEAAYKIGGYLDESGYPEHMAIDMLMAAGSAGGRGSHAENKATITSGLAAGRAKPRKLPVVTEAAIPAPLKRKAKAKAAPVAAEAAPLEPGAVDLPFDCLGYEHDDFYFYVHKSKSVVSLSAQSLGGKASLLRLAPLDKWESIFHGDWTVAADYLIQRSYDIGMFDPTKQRGRGAWFDNGHSVVHVGDRLFIDGAPAMLNDSRLSAFYEVGHPLAMGMAEPMTDEQGAEFAKVCDSLCWAIKDHGKLLSGWVALASICGGLNWRPHIWIVGSKGTGKSTVMDRIVGNMLGSMPIRVASSTTEAGIRQLLRHDARPILFDEAEGEDQRAQDRVQRIVELARQASSESGAVIAKGSMTGQAQTFNVRSMFALSCIGHNLVRAADVSRFSVLTLEKHSAGERHWKGVEAEIRRVCTPAMARALFARMVQLIPVVRANAMTIAHHLAPILGEQRHGDQYGALIAGWHALTSSAILDDEGARWLCSESFGHIRDLMADVGAASCNDEMVCLSYILERKITVEVKGGIRLERTIGELYDAPDNDPLPIDAVRAALGRVGLAFGTEGIFIANNHSGIAELLRGKPWANNHAAYIARIPGVTRGHVKKLAGQTTRCLLVPCDALPQ